MNVSYLITTHNEMEAEKVFHQVFPYANPSSPKYRGDEVVILDDYSTDERMLKLLSLWGDAVGCKVAKHHLNGDFGAHKTYGSRQCTGTYIVQLDADEYLSDLLLDNLHELLTVNSQVDLFRLPRVNIVRGITSDDINNWGWRLTPVEGYESDTVVNWPDYQARIYRNKPEIYWTKKLHETITGADIGTFMPTVPSLAIIHDKTIARQRKQNEFYTTNWSLNENQGKS